MHSRIRTRRKAPPTAELSAFQVFMTAVPTAALTAEPRARPTVEPPAPRACRTVGPTVEPRAPLTVERPAPRVSTTAVLTAVPMVVLTAAPTGEPGHEASESGGRPC